jgi:hypothetical protein
MIRDATELGKRSSTTRPSDVCNCAECFTGECPSAGSNHKCQRLGDLDKCACFVPSTCACVARCIGFYNLNCPCLGSRCGCQSCPCEFGTAPEISQLTLNAFRTGNESLPPLPKLMSPLCPPDCPDSPDFCIGNEFDPDPLITSPSLGFSWDYIAQLSPPCPPGNPKTPDFSELKNFDTYSFLELSPPPKLSDVWFEFNALVSIAVDEYTATALTDSI